MRALRARISTVTLLAPVLVAAACGDDSSSGSGSGRGGSSASAGSGVGGSSAGRGGSVNGGSGATAGIGGAGEAGSGGSKSGAGGEEGGEGGEAGQGGEQTGGVGKGGTSAGGVGGGGTAGTSTAGMAGGGTAGTGTAGMAGGGMAGGGAGSGDAGAVGGGMAGTGGGPTGPENCENSSDDDGDGLADCDDPDCALPCSLSCPSGTTRAVYSASDLPVAIPENSTAETAAISTLTIESTGRVADIAVGVSITHTYADDLFLLFQSPRGRLILSGFNGDGGDDYTRTVFAQSGATSITAGTAPFTGIFRPQESLRHLYGLPLAGSYLLRVSDRSAPETGSITAFSVATCECLGGCEFGPAACQNGLDDDGDGNVDCSDSACSLETVCTLPTEYACGDGIDNDGNGQVDCDDPNCSWACTTLGPDCTGSNRLFSYAPPSLPLTIPTAAGSLFAPIIASVPGTVVNAAVRFDATHSYVGDLYLLLDSGSGSLALTGFIGGSGDNYSGTIFADSGPAMIGTTGYNQAPFTGVYQPLTPLSFISGQPADAMFAARLYDPFTGDGGRFNEFSLALCVEP